MGTEFTASGDEPSVRRGVRRRGRDVDRVQLPVPDYRDREHGHTVTALTAAAGGFTADGTYITQAGPEVVIWTLPTGAAVTAAPRGRR